MRPARKGCGSWADCYGLRMNSSVPRELLERVVAGLRPEQVWLFGSRGRGDARPDSDWDLLAVLPDDAPDHLLDGEHVWREVIAPQRVPVDVVPVRRSEFDEMRRFAGSLCRTVALEGRQVYGDRVPPNPIVLGYLKAVVEDLDAAERLTSPPASRLADFHVQQAAEKLAKAVLTARGVHATREHRLQFLAESLPEGEPWRARLGSMAHVDRFATAFRYPGTSGRLPVGRPPDETLADVARLRSWVAEAEGEAGIGR